MRLRAAIFCLLFMLLCNTIWAQTNSISGIVGDSTDNTALIGVSVILQQSKDSTQVMGVVTDVEGKFTFLNVTPGSYTIQMSYIGYTTRRINVRVNEHSTDLGVVKLFPGSITLNAIEVKGAAIQIEQKGDTVQYNANAFKTNRDASAEDLVRKMPGIVSDETGVKAQGETVQQVLVDGKQFFGDDATLVLKNLPAEIIDKIEVFDRLSEQAQFTGFDDGQTRKTLNIVTKKGMNNGQFGRVYVGAGENGLYTAGGNINSFKGNRKLSLVGLSNNINQQNFSTEDLLGVTGSTSSNRGGRGGNNRGGGGGSNSSSNNFSVGQQSGISKTNSLGLNYSDMWGKKVEITASYFFNRMANEKLTDLSRLYITQQDSGLVYAEGDHSGNTNFNHRFNARLEYTIDSVNSIVISPRISFQKNEASSRLNGNYTVADEQELQNQIENSTETGNQGYNFSNSILYRHRFQKRRRSLSWNVNTEINNRKGNSELYSVNESSDETILIDQKSNNYTDSYTLSSNISYTEPLGKNGQLQINYIPTYTKSKTDKRTYNLDDETGSYTELETLLTNIFENIYVSNRGGVSYRYNTRKYNMSTGVNYQHANLRSDQDFPYVFQVNRSFQNLLPQANLNYKITQNESLRLTYRTNTNPPSISQLQNVIDNRNPLFLKTGNPNLSQDYSHALTARYNRTNINTSRTWLIMLSGSFVQNYITNASFIATGDTVFRGVTLSRGGQLSYPVNISGYRTARSLLTYGTPLTFLKCNVNINTGVNYNRIPAMINTAKNLADNYTLSQGIVISSNAKKEFDVTVSYSANYTIVKNSLQKQSDNNYFNQVTSLRLNWIFWKRFVFTSSVNNSLYRGLSAEFDQSIWLWNSGLGCKLLKEQALELKINVFDILNNNNSITRDITENYIEDRRTNVLNRYFMLVATYSIRNFKKS